MNQNPYKATGYSYNAVVAAQAGASERSAFIQKTYLHLLGAILAFAAIDTLIIGVFGDRLAPIVQSVGGMGWLVVLGVFMVVGWVADRWAHSTTSREMQYLGLGLYVLAEAIIFVPLLYIAKEFAPGVIQSAGIMTAVVFGGLTFVVLFTKTDFSFLRWAIVAGSFIALGLIVASVFLQGLSLGLWFSVAMVVLACAAILYSTSNVLHHYHTEQYVAASLTLFASVALLFWYLIQIFMSFEE